jgi:hypothetical protein
MLDLKESGDIEAHSHVVLLPYMRVADDGRPVPDEQLLVIAKEPERRRWFIAGLFR